MMEKRNVVEPRRTPARERTPKDLIKEAAAEFKLPTKPSKPVKP